MLDFISLKVKCPECHKSLMDKEKKIDNKPGIKLKVSIEGKEGFIWLSSIYGSYNYFSTIDIPNQVIADFSCPECDTKITNADKCDICGAPLAHLHLIEGGKISFCTRAGCKKHTISIDDLKTALNHFYKDFSYKGKVHDHIEKNISNNIIPPSDKIDDKEVIKTGTFLHSFCPHCKKSLIEENMLKLRIKKSNGECGILFLSPYFNVFSHKSTIRLPEKEAVQDIRCPHCKESLIEKENTCPECGSEVAKISVTALSKLIDFYICSKKGCTWHGLSDNDIKDIMFEDSEEW